MLSDSGGIPARVVVIEPTGAETLVLCRHGDTPLAAVFRERHAFEPGLTINLLPDPQRAHLFDAATGQRLAADAAGNPSRPASTKDKETTHG